jgi:hypothetical protein
MAFCTKCGLVIHDSKVKDHVCDPDNVPSANGKSKNQKKLENVLKKESDPNG